MTKLSLENPKEHIILKPRKHGNYQAPDFLVSIHKLGLSHEEFTNSLDYRLFYSDQELDGTPFIGDITYEEALLLNSKLGGFTLSLLELTDLMYRLLVGIGKFDSFDKNKKMFYADGTFVPRNIIEYMLHELIGSKYIERGEFLATEFRSSNGVEFNTVKYPKFDSNGNRVLIEKPISKNTLIGDFFNDQYNLSLWRYIGLNKSTMCGLPRKDLKLKGGELWYWPPVITCPMWKEETILKDDEIEIKKTLIPNFTPVFSVLSSYSYGALLNLRNHGGKDKHIGIRHARFLE